jgi:hypothetical protein
LLEFGTRHPAFNPWCFAIMIIESLLNAFLPAMDWRTYLLHGIPSDLA